MRPPFIQVLPDEVERYGAAAAIVLAHIRYRCGSLGPGRFEHEGSRWWRVSHADMGAELGLTARVVGRALTKLDGVVAANFFPPLEDQTLAYRVAAETAPDNPSNLPVDQTVEGVNGSDLPVDLTVEVPRPNGRGTSTKRSSAPLYGELGEGGEGAGGRGPTVTPPQDEQSANGKTPIADPDTEPTQWCPLHPGGTDAPCRACGIQRRAHTAWEGRQRERARANAQARRDLIADCPDCDDNGHIDLGDAVAKCQHPKLVASTGAR